MQEDTEETKLIVAVVDEDTMGKNEGKERDTELKKGN